MTYGHMRVKSLWPKNEGIVVVPFLYLYDDGTHKGEPVSQAVLDKQPNAQAVIPRNMTAVCSDAGNTQRDQHIRTIAQQGHMTWQRKTGYNLRNHAELAIQH